MDARVYDVEEVHIEALDVMNGAPPAVVVSARGRVNSTGWTNPQLAAWIYIQPPRDGILDLDFIATAPSGLVNFVMSPITVGLAFTVPGWVRGVRIHSSTNKMETLLEEPVAKGKMPEPKRGMPLPWPIPWQTPPQ